MRRFNLSAIGAFVAEHFWPAAFFAILALTWRELVLLRHDIDLLGLAGVRLLVLALGDTP